jgi:beta-lactamase regulating signal transducer with metallopeptidase domain
MTGVFDHLVHFISWLFFTSLKATIVLALILFVQIVFRKRLSAKWQHALWFLFIARLLIPVDVPSPISIFNLTKDVQYFDVQQFPELHMPPDLEFAAANPAVGQADSLVAALPPSPETTIISHTKNNKQSISFSTLLSILWLMGALGLLCYIIAMNLRLSWRLRRGTSNIDQQTRLLLEKCKERLDIKRTIEIVQLPSIASPFSIGIFKRRIVLPKEFLLDKNQRQLEHIFMHELVHFKKRDIPLAALATMLQILHWFNPLIWIAFFKMRADRELACDEHVLTILGKDKNIEYGRTLISLIESASQRGLLPVAVGLADASFNLKRRVTMIKNFSPKSIWWTALALFILSTSAVTVLTSAVEKGNVTGRVMTSGAEPDSFYVGIYNLKRDRMPVNYFGDPIAIYRSTKQNFDFQLERGSYCIAAWACGYQYAWSNFVVPNGKTTTRINFELENLGLSEGDNTVSIISDNNHWNWKKAVPLTFDGDVWRLISPEIKNGALYQFIIEIPHMQTSVPADTSEQNQVGKKLTPYGWQTREKNSSNSINLIRYAPHEDHLHLDPTYAKFVNIYDGGDIVLDPADFKSLPAKSRVEIHGLGYEEQLSRIFYDYHALLKKYYDKEHLAQLTSAQKFKRMNMDVDSLKAYYDPRLRTILAQEWLDYFPHIHPFKILQRQAYDNKNLDSLKYQAAFESKEFADFFNVCMRQFSDIDMNSPLIDSKTVKCLKSLQYYYNHAPKSVRDKYGLSENHFEDLVMEIMNNSNRATASSILADLIIGSTIGLRYEKAAYYLEWMKRDYADTPAYLENVTDKYEPQILFRLGAPLPYFKTISLDGETVESSDYKGKFLFLDFWAIWSGQSEIDIPHKISLVQSIPSDSLAYLGFVKDDGDPRSFIKKHNIPYTNAILHKELEQQFGIEHLPTTYLIDPEGKIVAKDLGGEHVLSLVREQMQKYKNKGDM